MNRSESLLLQVAEEASEVAQAASKCIRFGPTDTWKSHPEKGQARERLYQEFLECLALIEMCQDEGLLPQCVDEVDRLKIEAKKERVEKYLKISTELGTIK